MERRNFLTGALVASVAVAVPAMASCPDHAFKAALAEYHRLVVAHDTHPYGECLSDDPRYDQMGMESRALGKRRDEAMRRLMAIPSTNVRDIAEKLDILSAEYQWCEMDNDLVEMVARDARRLAA